MTFTLPRLLWADSGETPVVLAETEWNSFVLFARTEGVWKTMSEPMTAHDAKNPYAKRLPGYAHNWAPAEPDLNRWLDGAYADLVTN